MINLEWTLDIMHSTSHFTYEETASDVISNLYECNKEVAVLEKKTTSNCKSRTFRSIPK